MDKNSNSAFKTKSQSLYISGEKDKEKGHSSYNSIFKISSGNSNIKMVQSMEDDSDDKSLKFLDNALSKNEWPNNPIFDNIIKGKFIYYLIKFIRYAISSSRREKRKTTRKRNKKLQYKGWNWKAEKLGRGAEWKAKENGRGHEC